MGNGVIILRMGKGIFWPAAPSPTGMERFTLIGDEPE
jgi:hypothetical protein